MKCISRWPASNLLAAIVMWLICPAAKSAKPTSEMFVGQPDGAVVEFFVPNNVDRRLSLPSQFAHDRGNVRKRHMHVPPNQSDDDRVCLVPGLRSYCGTHLFWAYVLEARLA